MNFDEFHRLFPDEDSCLDFLYRLRVHPCHKCGRTSYSRRTGRQSYICSCGKYELYPRKGTIMEKSSLPLRKWFYLLFLFSQKTYGLSSPEIRKHVGCSARTAWSIGMKVRKMMKEDITLQNVLESDETMVGGRKYGGKRGRGSNKMLVLGMIERNGKMIMRNVDTVETIGMTAHFKNVHTGSTLVTDEWRAYRRIAKEHGLRHHAIKHKEYIWSRGDWNTNTIEGQWSHLKKGIKTTYNMVSKKYLQHYLDERCFAFNHREEDRFLVLLDRLRSSS